MAQKFVWTKEYSVEVAELDEQHKSFFDICNALLEIAQKDTPLSKDETLMKIMKLVDYASYHLESEEKLFKQTGYPDAAAHIESHNNFKDRAKDFVARAQKTADTGIKKIAEDAANFAGEWLMKHILIMDKKYSPYLNEHGIK